MVWPSQCSHPHAPKLCEQILSSFPSSSSSLSSPFSDTMENPGSWCFKGKTQRITIHNVARSTFLAAHKSPAVVETEKPKASLQGSWVAEISSLNSCGSLLKRSNFESLSVGWNMTGPISVLCRERGGVKIKKLPTGVSSSSHLPSYFSKGLLLYKCFLWAPSKVDMWNIAHKEKCMSP